MNTRPPRSWTWILGIIALAVMVTAQSTRAAEQEAVWQLRLDVSWVDPAGDFSANVGGTTVETSYDTGFGGGFRGEYQFSTRLGVELGVLGASSVKVTSGTFGGTTGTAVEVSSFTPYTVGLNVHLTPDRSVDLYVGPQLALVSYSGVDVRVTAFGASTTVSVDDDVGWGAIVGLDIPLGKHGWLIQTNLRYIDTDIKGSRELISINSAFDPLIFSIGFGYRF